ncbi:acetamidase/formamidase family protein [Mycobacterium sp. AT1]|uniref:acetamidase/formamidase family protein n=1 Tax=Mycobacterium sp. AT1 TaxID=1961706 RepID=UPI0009AE7D13|nr:acetamidase/formamidase family protein [Mycobacterium sp. AT1]OPX06155.1 acetamidase [Mycobacterium sp. AT1]
MATVEFTPTPEQYVWTFGGAEPVMEVAPGTVLKLWTEDAFAGRVTSSADKPSEVLNPKELNPQTGPFYVTGAEPGDTLALHVVSLEPARDWAASTTIPLFGALTGTDRTAGLQPPLPELTWIYQIDRAAGQATFVAHETGFTMTMPLAPMLGTVGVAPALREVRTTLVPDYFGGNMDTPELRAGTTVYLGVNVDGALFSVGDGHYRQGEGETCGTALEGAMNVTIVVDLIKGGAPAWPRLEHDDALLTVGSARPLEDAWRCSQVEMVRWLTELYGLGPMDAYQVCSQLCQSPLANVVDVNYSAVTKIAKSLLPQSDPYAGTHQRLRAVTVG